MTELPVAPEVFGITRLAEQGSLLPINLPVWCAFRPSAKSFAVTNGKGHTHEHARLSAAMEAVECACAEDADHLIVHWASIDELIRENAPILDLKSLLSVHFQNIDPSRKRGWVRGTDLATGADILAPYEVVGLDYRINADWDSDVILMNSAGLAAHTDAAAATLHALQELIEQEARLFLTSISGYARKCGRLDPFQVLPEGCTHLLSGLSMGEAWVELIDATTDISVPVIMAILHEGDSGAASKFHAAGCACRPDVQSAAEAALLEAVQSRVTDFAGSRDDIVPGDYALRDLRLPKVRKFSAPPMSLETEDPLAGVQDCLSRAGLPRIYKFDLSPADGKVVCHKLIVPGLECIVESGRQPRRGRRFSANVIRSLLP